MDIELLKMLDAAGIPIGCSVTKRISMIKQPRGGYINPKEFEQIQLEGGDMNDLNVEENISPSLVGLTVDYLTRIMTGSSVADAFEVAGLGASIVSMENEFVALTNKVTCLDDESIIAAAKLSGFDSAYRAGIRAYTPIESIEPNTDTIENIRTMVNRSLCFFQQYGPKVMDHLTFEGGYTDKVRSGDGDFLTADTLWDFKVSKQKLLSKYTLQLLMYWRMGLHSVHPEYKNVRFLGVYNPRMNLIYKYDVGKLSKDIIREVEENIIGYNDRAFSEKKNGELEQPRPSKLGQDFLRPIFDKLQSHS